MQPSPLVDRIHTPASAHVCIALWCLCALGILFNIWMLATTLLNLAFARYFFVRTRRSSILRGMGAPGHIAYWLAGLLFLLALSARYDVHAALRGATLFAFRLDFACIMIAAAVSKIASGYPRNDGFQTGLANPWWGHNPRFATYFPANGMFYRLLNHAAYVVEIGAGIAFLIPPAAPYAAMVLALNFLLIGRFIRLTGLAEMVAACCLLYIQPHTAISAFLVTHFPVAATSAATSPAWAAPWIHAASALLTLHAFCLPLAYAGMAINFYGRYTLPRPLQRALDAWMRFLGLTLWRVFTNEIINFFCEIAVEHDGARTPIRGRRFGHVAESITLASIFTTLKYHPAHIALFEQRLLTYAATLPPTPNASIVFRYVRISREQKDFRFHPIAEFAVDPTRMHVRESVLDATFDARKAAPGSPVRANAVVSGTYACE
jgi:uncharacterized membrane protein YphA (DoxX/SURF4 family)